MKNIITSKNLCKIFYDDTNEVRPVKDISIQIEEGSFVSIVGRSGSGKTTLLKLLSGLLSPTSGTVMINGQDLSKMSDRELSKFRSDKIGFVFQDFLLEEAFSVQENIEIALMISGVTEKKRAELIDRALESVRLADKKNTKVKVLSGGEKQRVSIARAIVNDPDIVFADEPCGNLDYENGIAIMGLFREQCKKGKTVVLITHNREDALRCDRMITIQDGLVVGDEVCGSL